MTHDTLKEMVFLSYDKELSPADQAQVQQHLTVCPECRTALETWKKNASLLFAPAPSLSEQFVHKVMGRIAEQSVEKLSLAFKIKILLDDLKAALTPRRWILAGTAALAVGMVFISQPFKTEKHTPDVAIAYASDLMEGPFAYTDYENSDESTPIEKYFL